MERGIIQRIYKGGISNPDSNPDLCVLVSLSSDDLKKGDPSVGINGTVCEVVHVEYNPFGNLFHLSDGSRCSNPKKIVHVFKGPVPYNSGPCMYHKKGKDFQIFPSDN